MIIFLLIIGCLIYLIKSLDFTYLFQTKEYRFDRIFSLIKEEGILSLLYSHSPRLPAKSVRNIINIIAIFLLIIIYFNLLIDLTAIQIILSYLIIPIISFLIVSILTALTSIPVKIYRLYYIHKASDLVKQSKAIFIGITGSYGKTSTKEFLFQILAKKFKVAKTDANQNSDIGVALSIIKNLQKDTQFFITEIGAYKKGEIKAVCDFIHPKYAIITAIGNQHLDLFGSEINLLNTKKELLLALPKNGIAYINKDIKNLDLFIKNIQATIISFSTEKIPQFPTQLIGQHNLANLIPCITLAKHLGMSQSEIESALKNLKPLYGRLSYHQGHKGCTILNDTYNSNVDGFIAAIKTADQFNLAQKIIISKGIIELGREKKSSYQKIIAALNTSNLVLYTTDKLFKNLDTNHKVSLFPNEKELFNKLKVNINDQTLIIVEGRFSKWFLTGLLR